MATSANEASDEADRAKFRSSKEYIDLEEKMESIQRSTEDAIRQKDQLIKTLREDITRKEDEQQALKRTMAQNTKVSVRSDVDNKEKVLESRDYEQKLMESLATNKALRAQLDKLQENERSLLVRIHELELEVQSLKTSLATAERATSAAESAPTLFEKPLPSFVEKPQSRQHSRSGSGSASPTARLMFENNLEAELNLDDSSPISGFDLACVTSTLNSLNSYASPIIATKIDENTRQSTPQNTMFSPIISQAPHQPDFTLSSKVRGIKGLAPDFFSSNGSQLPDVPAKTVKKRAAKNMFSADFFSPLTTDSQSSSPPSENPQESDTEPHHTPSSTSQPSQSTPTKTPQHPSTAHTDPPSQLIRGFSASEDVNKNGLRRAKKKFMMNSKGKSVPSMEDAHFCSHPFDGDQWKGLFSICDGHAGKEAAEDAVKFFPQEWARESKDATCTNFGEALTRTFLGVDKLMLEHEYMGTTATLLYVWRVGDMRYLQCANVGDSSAFLCRNDVAVALTRDHKPSAQFEKDRMRASGLDVLDSQTRINGLAVSRSLGNHFVKEQNLGMIADPYVSEPFALGPSDSFVVLASDGLWDVMSGQRAVDLVKGIDDPEQMADTLLQTALQHAKCNDNVTVIVVRLN